MSNFNHFICKVLFAILCVLSTSTTFAQNNEVNGSCGVDDSFPLVADMTLGYENFRSVPDGSWTGNSGAFGSINFAMPLYRMSCYGFGAQLGGSYGVYNWLGKGSALEGCGCLPQQQGFVTAGIFRRTPCETGVNAAIAYDAMFNENYGVFVLDASFYQLRYSGSYQFCSNEFGVWGTVHTNTSHRSTLDFPVDFRAIDQVSLFWSHFFDCAAETSVWAGVPYGDSLNTPGSRPGQFLVGASFRVPISDSWSIDGRALYMNPIHPSEDDQSKNYASNVCVGISYCFGASYDCCDQSSALRPYLPVANNSNFLADTSLNY